ncbi:MAG TPA: UDP-N-acetylglucosamine--N-acetylmuramyl-(pentapeptide) pyrophosphoryl-undecaprenol N-acetylglucosamine transferase [Candidatus Bathyarchaeia archaeon]|nr:UDP-N-acetylglucosamine--N-acetylmuramyl-(pentapeptide) pyrophosphoryl-undecaprenol N-acetylglucosamine transferase [Candidatus Bathyarchaeia archaeon]
MKKKSQDRVIITGGHHNSALVVAEKLRKKGYKVIWFGHKFSMWGDKKPGAEYEEVTRAGFEFIEIKAGKFYRTYHPLKLVRIPFGFVQSFYCLLKFRPNLILSFGGYLAVPVVISGWLMRVPIITHEQTVVYGLANRVIQFFAKKILVSWESSLKHFPARKAIHTGLPVRPEIFNQIKGKFDFKNDLLTLYVTGGKQGSHLINQVLAEALPELVEKYNLIHQCGRSTIYDDLAFLSKIKSRLPEKLKKRYLVRDYIFQPEIGSVFAVADLVVSRAGAHITYEIAALGKPTLFIPIPWSHANEQFKNAQILKQAGLAEILIQEKLSAENLSRMIRMMIANLDQYKKSSAKAQKLVKLDAAKKIVELVKKL